MEGWIILAAVAIAVTLLLRRCYRPGSRVPVTLSRGLLQRLATELDVCSSSFPLFPSFFAIYSLRRKAWVALYECMALEHTSAMLLLTIGELTLAKKGEARGNLHHAWHEKDTDNPALFEALAELHAGSRRIR